MKTIISILILSSFFLTSFSQAEDYKIKKLIVGYSGDSTQLKEEYEIDFSRKKVFYITPVANYLHIKGGKLKTKISLNRKEWKQIAKLGLMIDFEKLLPYSLSNEQKSLYFIERLSNHDKSLILRFNKESRPEELNRLLDTIRTLK